MIRKILFHIIHRLVVFYKSEKSNMIMKSYGFRNVRMGEGFLNGNITLGKDTYINGNYRIVSGVSSKVFIGSNCSIGRNFNCASRTHDPQRPTSDENFDSHLQKEKDVIIENSVWIGDNVIILPGTHIESHAIVGANSIVKGYVRPFEIVGGSPAKHIRFNTDHYLYKSLTEDKS